MGKYIWDSGTLSICETCGQDHEPPVGDKADGQVCAECAKGGPLLRVKFSADDDKPRYMAGYEVTAEWIEEGAYGSWKEFNEEERNLPGLARDEDARPQIDGSSLDTLITSAQSQMNYLTAFWSAHYDLLVRRDKAMDKWTRIKSGEWTKPIIWTDVPQFVLIIEEVK